MPLARPIELLAPAKDLNCGIEAIRHGADAVYIGAPKYSARAAAGNTLEDIQQLCNYAHLFNVRVYIAFNTILYEDELEEAEQLINQLYNIGVDALIIQDMGILKMNLPPIPLHASTQADNCTLEKILFWEQVGIKQVVLARELTLDEISKIASQTNVTLEAFIHGALCVSYSGRCYLSQAFQGRSANRGECAQLCRLPYTLVDSDENIIMANKHLLSLKDLNASDELEALLQAGVSSLKIEGRLKDLSYVKNITAFYRKKLDNLFTKNPTYYRPSAGVSTYTFQPQPDKSFNRGFTNYFLHGRSADIIGLDTPKSIGEPVGVVKEIKGNSFTIAGLKSFHNGDGFAFINIRGELEGFRANRIENNRIFPLKMPSLKTKMPIYRNYDKAFEDNLLKPSAERRLIIQFKFGETPAGFSLSATDETGVEVLVDKKFPKELARYNQTVNIKKQLSKLGDTPFQVNQIIVAFSQDWFVPSSLLSEMRREVIRKIQEVRVQQYKSLLVNTNQNNRVEAVYPETNLEYNANVANSKSAEFYRTHGVKNIDSAFELSNQENVPLMQTKHCIRFTLRCCPVYQQKVSKWKEPFYLTHKEIRLRLQFDCKKCQMLVYK